jgi:hypothetical protein
MKNVMNLAKHVPLWEQNKIINARHVKTDLIIYSIIIIVIKYVTIIIILMTRENISV